MVDNAGLVSSALCAAVFVWLFTTSDDVMSSGAGGVEEALGGLDTTQEIPVVSTKRPERQGDQQFAEALRSMILRPDHSELH